MGRKRERIKVRGKSFHFFCEAQQFYYGRKMVSHYIEKIGRIDIIIYNSYKKTKRNVVP